MYLRRDRKVVGKKRLTYLSIAHTVTEDSPLGKRSKPIVFANLGNEEAISEKHARQLLRSLDKYMEQRWGSKKKPTRREIVETAQEVRKQERSLRILATKDLGMRLLLEAAWKDLGIGKALTDFSRDRRVEFAFERVVFAMVLNRLYDPMSKNACNEWVKTTGFMPEAEGWDVQHFYRAMDVLHDHWDELEGHLEARIREGLTPEEQRLRLVDTTSLYFEARSNDQELANLADRWDEYEADPDVKSKPPRRSRPATVNEPAFRMQGHNKDGHPGDPQVVIASECVEAGYVLRHRTFPGNTSDITVAKALVASLPSTPTGQERVWVSDAGMMSKGLMETLDSAGWHRLSAEGPRKSSLGAAVLSEVKGRFCAHSSKPHMTYKTLTFAPDATGTGRAERLIASRNEKERERKLEKLQEQVDKAAEGLARQRAEDSHHPRSVCKVAAHLSLGRLVKPSDKVPGTFVLAHETIRREEQLAGVRFYRTTVLDWTPEAALAAYGTLQEVEANHKLMKGPLKLQPCYHRTTERIEAHIMLTMLATNCVRHLERLTGQNYKMLVELFKPLKATQLDDGRGAYWQRSETTPGQEAVLESLGITIPPTSWEKWIEVKKRASKSRNQGPTRQKAK